MPIGIWLASRAMKKAALARPSPAGDSARSSISSGPSVLVEARKNWLAIVIAVAATRTRERAAAMFRREISRKSSSGSPSPAGRGRD
jgi:hypothetical protein